MPRSPELARVKRAADRRRRADLEYRNAIVDARAAGRSLAEIATEAGVSRQAVRKTQPATSKPRSA